MSCLGHLFRCNWGPFVKNKSRFVNYTSVEIVLIFAEERPHDITIPLRHETIKREYMTGNFVMLQMDDLRQVVTEIVEEVCAKRGFYEKPSEEEGEWLPVKRCATCCASPTRLYDERKTKVSSRNTRWADATSIPRKR